jgi:hypothetical protein
MTARALAGELKLPSLHYAARPDDEVHGETAAVLKLIFDAIRESEGSTSR